MTTTHDRLGCRTCTESRCLALHAPLVDSRSSGVIPSARAADSPRRGGCEEVPLPAPRRAAPLAVGRLVHPTAPLATRTVSSHVLSAAEVETCCSPSTNGHLQGEAQ
jgi:hypothetical protein